ncbi:MAG: zinc-ribbon domain-containing protein [Chloroflexi bacterium]|nr:zinc-ribbon domain-containing protein [Chloroflexota bacterium]
MATRFCANCGTEVDETASFCPTCGQPTDQAAPAEMPEAPAWPDPEPSEREPEPAPDVGPTRVEARPADSEPEAGESPPSQPAQRAAPPEPERSKQSGSPSVNVPFTMPVTLSAWLIGAGAIAAALGLVIGLFDGQINLIDLLLLLALLAIAATVFFSASVPDIANLRIITLAVVLIGFGMALDRIGFGRAGIGDLLLFLGTAAAAMGAILLELGHDQPLGGPAR